MMETLERRADKALAKGVTGLLLDHPFFGAVLMRSERRADWRIDTMCVDGVTLSYNPAFAVGLTESQLVTVLAHESLHIALGHPWRLTGPGWDHERANIAADHAINLSLVASGFTPLDNWLCDSQYADMSAEQIYNLLTPPPGPEPQERKGNEPGNESGPDKNKPGNSNPPQITGEFKAAPEGTSESDNAISTAQAGLVAAAGGGEVPEPVAKLLGIEERAANEIDWREMLPRFLASAGVVTGTTWSRPNRRYIPSGLYMPSTTREGTGAVVVAPDTSGSVSFENVKNSLRHVNAMMETVEPEQTHVVFWGSGVVHTSEYQAGERIDSEDVYYPGGGTNFYSVLAWLETLPQPPTALVVLTDGYFSGGAPSATSEPACPVCFVITPDSHLTREHFASWPYGEFTFQSWRD